MTHGLSVITTFRHLQQLTSIHQKAGKNDEYSTIADVDAIFLAAGEDEPVRKGTAFQVRLRFSYLRRVDLALVSFHRHGFLDMSFPPHSFCSRKTSYLYFALRQRVLHSFYE